VSDNETVEKLARLLHNEFSRVNEPDASWDSCTDQQKERWRRSAHVVLDGFATPAHPVAFIRGAEAMRKACVSIAQPLGNYSDSPEMQERLKVRAEITQTIDAIDVGSLTE
jgi:hypothetical protein